ECGGIGEGGAVVAPASWQVAVVTKVEPEAVQLAGLPDGEGTLPFAEMTWAAPNLPEQRLGAPPRSPKDVVAVGDVIVVEKVTTGAAHKTHPPQTYALRP